MLASGLGRHAAAPRPQLRVCYLCGQQFGSASIGIHIPQCYAKKVAQWQVADPATRGGKPKHPDSVDWKGNGKSTKRLNDEQFKEFEANLVPCPHCGRTFLPDRLPVHLRGCSKSSGAGNSSRPHTQGGSPRSGTASSAGESPQRLGGSTKSASGSRGGSRSPRSSSPARRPAGFRPTLPTCYLCGQQFGTASIAIHVPQCYTKKRARWEAADPATRGKAPKHPDTVSWRPSEGTGASGGDGALSSAGQSDAQFEEFVRNLEPCPHCGRKFLADRLVVHLRSCRPGNTAKRVGTRTPPADAKTGSDDGLKSSDLARATQTAKKSTAAASQSGAVTRADDGGENTEPSGCSTDELQERLKELGRINPIKNRVPKDSQMASQQGRSCPRCEAVEYDGDAKYCRECGWNLNSHSLADPCATCGECVPEGSRFCATCGNPVNGAAASERVAGGENANAPTVRVVTCPACQAVCDADGNFCDNCGAVLGDAEPNNAEVEERQKGVQHYMFCPECKETVEDVTAVYCEDCGGKLLLMEKAPTPLHALSGSSVGHLADTLRPDAVPGAASPPPAGVSPGATRDAAGPKAPGVSSARSTDVGRQRASRPPEPPAEVSEQAAAETDAETQDREECPHCGRKFVPEALARHVNVCSHQSKRRAVFNMTRQRLADCDAPPKSSSGRRSKSAANDGAAPAPKSNWKAESDAFRRAMRDARQVDKVLKTGGTAKNLPPPTYSENAHYIPCPHCQRKFAPDVAERHIPRCANTVNRPKPPPRRR